MKGKSYGRRTSSRRRSVGKEATKMKGTLARHLQNQLGQVSLFPLHQQSSSSAGPRFQNLLEAEARDSNLPSSSALALDHMVDNNVDDKDFILSQDFFCTPDYITPDNQYIFNGLDCNKENIPCPKSPEKLNTTKSKRCRLDGISGNPLSPTLSGGHQTVELGTESAADEEDIEKLISTAKPKAQNYLSHSVVALRSRVIPPPCIRNPYLKDDFDKDKDPYGNQRSKYAGLFPPITGGDGLSRYRTDFHEIEQIGTGNFSNVFKVLKRIDGCLYAVKQSTRQLCQETERRKALMEVQALAALGSYENIVGYYSSWFENERLYIQMELCDHSLSISKANTMFTEGQVLEVLHQCLG